VTSTGRVGFVGVDRRWLNDPTLSDSALRLMLWLESHTHAYLANLHVKRCAIEIGWSRARVSRALADLEQLGLVSTEVVKDHASGARTAITLHQSAWTERTCATRRDTPVQHDDTQAVQHGVAPTTSNPNGEESIEKPPLPPKGDDPSFELFWKAWPHRRTKKPNARRAWERAVKRCHGDITPIRNGFRAWRTYWQAPGNMEFCPYPSSWLNGEQYNDEPPWTDHDRAAAEVDDILNGRTA